MQDIDTYIASAVPAFQPYMHHIRELVRQLVPDAVEKISYGMPGFYYKDRYLLTYGAFKDHLSIFPGAAPVAELEDQLTAFKTAKGTIQFSPEHPLSDELISSIVLNSKAVIDNKG